jgi:hypothetical protein
MVDKKIIKKKSFKKKSPKKRIVSKNIPIKSKKTSFKTKKVISYPKKKDVLLKKPNNSNSSFGEFLRKLLTFNSYYDFLFFLTYILLFIIICNFLINLSAFSIAPSIIVYYTNLTLFYKLYNVLFLLSFFFIYFLFAYEALKINLNFKYFFKAIFNISLFLFFVETLLLFISYFSFLKDYYLLFNITNTSYVFYLIFWILIKYVILLFITIIIYRLFKIYKKRLIWY